MRRPAGYSACMRSSAARSSPSSAVSTVRRSVRRTLRGVRTLGWVLLGWSHRHSVALWWRSIVREVRGCDLFVTIGSSGVVYPAAGLVRELLYRRQMGETCRSVYVGLEEPANADSFQEVRLGKAGEVLPTLFRVT